MEIIGYSERGMLNSLFYEIAYSKNNLQLLNQFFKLVCFPYRNVNFQISDAKLLLEQSFSDFGDADAVFLLDNNNRQVAFIEAKVNTPQRSYISKGGFDISMEFEEFMQGMNESDPHRSLISNLFVQLYLKLRLIKALQHGDLNQLKEGLQFPRCLSKKSRKTHKRDMPRKIGDNDVVLKAINLLKEYSRDALFIALVPEESSELAIFYRKLREHKLEEFQEWDVTDWGYISWADVEIFCEKHNLVGTLKNFAFNGKRIYAKKSATRDNRVLLNLSMPDPMLPGRS
ncbi:MAG: hypothetical protein AB1665_06365 [Candidatus Thermoplasmatota archaeon]